MKKLERASYIAGIIEAIFVIASVIFIAFEVQNQTSALQSQNALQLTSLGMTRVYHGESNPELIDLVIRGEADFNSLNAPEKQRFKRYVVARLFMIEDIYYQYKRGYIDDVTMQLWESNAARYRGELSKKHWDGWESFFTEDFAKYFKSLTPKEPVGHL